MSEVRTESQKTEYVLEIKNLNKTFGPTWANKNVSLDLKKGEIRGIVGENGCGKSTLMSIIAGMQPMDSGEMYVNGQRYNPQNILDAGTYKIGMVVQELGLLDGLPGYTNMYFGKTKQFSTFGIISLKKMRKAAEESFRAFGLAQVNLTAPAGTLTVEERKLIELARALSIDPDILILDELTNALSHDNRAVLYDIIRKYREMGKSMLIISHDMEEIVDLTDTVTVMRDGEIIGTKKNSEITAQDLKYMMVGRNIEDTQYSASKLLDEKNVILRVNDVSNEEFKLKNVSFELHAGEILGLCGLSDAGTHDIGKILFGIEHPDQGSVEIVKNHQKIKKPADAIKNAMGYVPKDRDHEGLLLGASIEDNLCIPSIPQLKGRFGMIRPKVKKQYASDVVRNFEIKTTSASQITNSLSGGNKQKVNLGRWMSKELEVLVLDCPTRGVDIGVKQYIYKTMVEARDKGLGIILISDELPEIINMSDRIIVMKDGRISAEFVRGVDAISENAIIEVMI